MAGNNGGPWGGGGDDNQGKNDGNGSNPPPRPPRRTGEGPQIPEIDELMNKGREQLRVLMGGRGGGNGTGGGGTGGGNGPALTRGTIGLGVLAAAVLWGMASIYTVKPEEQSVELLLGDYMSTNGPGLNFAPWPIVTREVLAVTSERSIDIGTSRSGLDAGLMLTGDENIVDIDFQVVWNILDPQLFLFNLADPEQTIEAVSESVMREIIAQSQLAPILNRDRGSIAERLKSEIQSTLDSYQSGVNIIRVNFDKADPPEPVIASFRKVQDAEQERDRLQNVADAYANRVEAEARGQAAQTIEQAEGYRAQTVNEASGEASRFSAVLTEYQKAPEVTRKRLYLETMEKVLGELDIILLDESQGGQGVVPYLPLNQLGGGSNRPQTQTTEGTN
ncbi:FtsH protease activity modulator HflK [Loktanella salsilacus]|jgi:membrane protease subunit HflK|uniref:FtsH protease activity modulator HflK n=1 Tax=Loktanella salsilacus TaxID=195913 RepID=UPI001ED2ED84|nr:FtsH protease activity modulator HflK [Loktanella salsilacus]MBU0861404.1 FtsH protease activity modulator HflK [Alphaproteobacteria bacterium]MBU1834504.1 FtsH protease activity modulator HflK [Alphaproteobacteria bacterium]UTH45247.1 FtsH protease activity modulator HflK [Loktanella salsilacus]UTH49057.1 FtsH protease activity modulator HflK [Loktanella salsilacus]|tara:strand:+ start:1799 stop:2971 length:1173 start_codon:yes stop_codon:yes gene_type:complete